MGGKPQGVYLGHQEKSHQKILLVFLDWILLAKYKNTDHQVPNYLEADHCSKMKMMENDQQHMHMYTILDPSRGVAIYHEDNNEHACTVIRE